MRKDAAPGENGVDDDDSSSCELGGSGGVCCGDGAQNVICFCDIMRKSCMDAVDCPKPERSNYGSKARITGCLWVCVV